MGQTSSSSRFTPPGEGVFDDRIRRRSHVANSIESPSLPGHGRFRGVLAGSSTASKLAAIWYTLFASYSFAFWLEV
jgi:hypothetical protein